MQMPVECRMELSHQRKELSGSSDNFLQAFLIARGLAHEQPTHEVAMALNAILCNAKATDAARWPLVLEAASRMSLVSREAAASAPVGAIDDRQSDSFCGSRPVSGFPDILFRGVGREMIVKLDDRSSDNSRR